MGKVPLSERTIVSSGAAGIGQAGASGKSCLIRIHPAGPGEGLIELPQTRYIIGREDCSLELPDSAVSRQHAYIEPRMGNYMICDMGSLNGTHVNDKLIDKQFLIAGDLIRIGTTILKYLSSDHIEAQYHETIYSMMISDGLTGIHNKRYFMEVLERELVRSQRHGRPLSLAIFDIDHFKKINDTYGHPVGDAVLRELCSRIRSTIRKDEVFARYGGEEFVVILPESTVEQACGFGSRLLRLVGDKAMEVGNTRINVTISIGIAQTTGERLITPQELIEEADRKLYQAKAGGRNRLQL